jgi:class 3 adenylate cyclase
MAPTLPTGTVCFLFTDVEESTRLWQLAPGGMRAAMARHDALLRVAVEGHGGGIYLEVGDGLQAAFPSAPAAVAAALGAQLALHGEDWAALGLPEPLRVRMALHAAAVLPDDRGMYRAPELNRLGRLLDATQGGRVLLSEAAAALARDGLPDGSALADLGNSVTRRSARPSGRPSPATRRSA